MTPQEFKAWRKDLEMTQEKAGRLLGASRRSIIDWEQNEHAVSPLAAAHIKTLNTLDRDVLEAMIAAL